MIVDHNNEIVTPITLNTIAAAKQIGGDVCCLVAGEKVSSVVAQLAQFSVIKKILIAENETYKGFLPESLTPLVVSSHKQFNFSHILAGANAMGKVIENAIQFE